MAMRLMTALIWGTISSFLFITTSLAAEKSVDEGHLSSFGHNDLKVAGDDSDEDSDDDDDDNDDDDKSDDKGKDKKKDDDSDDDDKSDKDDDDSDDDDDDDDEETTKIKFTPYAAISGGYNSNPNAESSRRSGGFDGSQDEIGGAVSSYFHQYDLGGRLSYEADKIESELIVKGFFARYPELEDQNYWGYSIYHDTDLEYSDQTDINFGFTLEHESLFDFEYINVKSYLGVETRLDDFWQLNVEGSVEHDANLTSEPVDEDEEDFEEPNNYFDYTKVTADIKILADRKSNFRPYIRTILDNIHFPNQDEEEINRNARNFALIYGVEMKVSPTLTIDLAGRYNVRHLDDEEITKVSNNFVKLDVTWKPIDWFKLNASIDRYLEEPVRVESRVADVTEYDIDIDIKLSDHLTLELDGSYELTKEIGSDLEITDRELGAALFYQLEDNWRLFGKVSKIWTEEYDVDLEEEDDKYDEFIVRIGAELAF